MDFFPESDPLKNRAKDKALAIMENLVLVDKSQGLQGWAQVVEGVSNDKLRARIVEDIDVFLGYLWIGKSQGWLNSINFLIIANEYEKIKKELKPVAEERAEIQLNPKPQPQPSSVGLSGTKIRQKKILDFISQNGKAQVMDLQAVLPKITKRTIRRDIDELLKSGKIIRMGEFNQIFYKLMVS